MTSAKEVQVLSCAHGVREGTDFPLVPGQSYIVGRSSDANIVLADDSVSRKHMRVFFRRGACWLNDLGSVNGTFVNGLPVTRHRLKLGDRIVIGANLLRYENADAERLAAAAKEAGGVRSMVGSLDDIPLVDVLQWLATSRKTGVLRLTGDINGALYMRDGDVYSASIEGSEAIHPEKALMRMLRWTKGTFELDTNDPKDVPAIEIAPSLNGLLMEAARQQDELAHLAEKSPLPSETISFVSESKKAWRDLSPEQLDLIQAVGEGKSWTQILDADARDDVTITKLMVQLHKQGVVHFGVN